MNNVINFKEKFSQIEQFSMPTILAQFDDYQISAAKMKGESLWLANHDSDQLFIVAEGMLTISLHDGDVVLHAGECYIIPKGVEHKYKALESAHVLFIEKVGSANMTDDPSKRKTVIHEEWL